jgi:hypothetical protein
MKRKAKKMEYSSRPRLHPRFGLLKPGRLILEPHRIGMLVGMTLATLVLLVQLLRQWQGADLAPTTVIVGVCSTFIVAYGGAGLFVIYLLYIAEKELDVIRNAQQKADKSNATNGVESIEN